MSIPIISEARKAAARANGAKSRGPVTIEGKAISSRNATRHGMTIQALVLPAESREAAAEVLADLTAALKPKGPVEHRAVEMLALYEWQTLRGQSILQGLFLAATQKLDPDTTNPHIQTAEMFRHAATDDAAFKLLLRYTGEIRRSYTAKFREIDSLQARRKADGAADTIVEAGADIQDQPASEPAAAEPETNLTPEARNEPSQGDRYPGTPRTALCPCHSGEKYKRCCGRQAPPILLEAA